MKPGRNDPCPCGSGLKYKKCCLARDEAAAAQGLAADTDEASWRDRVLSRLMRFTERPALREGYKAALGQFMDPERLHAERDRERVDGAVEASQAPFHSWFCFDYVLPTGVTPTAQFLAGEGERLSGRERAHLERLRDSRLGLYEIQEVWRERGLRVTHLATGESVDVRERAATRQAVRFDLLAMRLVPFEDGALEIEGGVLRFPPRSKQALLDLVKRHRRTARRRAGADPTAFAKAPAFAVAVQQAWFEWVAFPPLPTLVTSEGEPVVLAKSLFDMKASPGTVRAILDRHPELCQEDDEYSWGEPAGGERRALGRIHIDGGRLVLETMSRERAERGRALLETALRDAIRHRATRFEAAWQASASVRGQRRREEPCERVPTDIEARLLDEYKDRHYREWLDQPVPALGGRTPRAAARLKTGRARLIDLLKDFENAQARAEQAGQRPYDFSWLWTELGLTR